MIQWYPGHMARARKILKNDLKLVDLVLEVLDARIPYSSRNPDLDEILGEKERIVVLNKIDLADEKITDRWVEFYQKEYKAVKINSLTGTGVKDLQALINDLGNKINERIVKKGRNRRDIRIMIIGTPNVGKSALINVLAGSSITRTGNKPGVTRGRQWIKISSGIQLLDTPGILWPRFDDEDTGYRLALTGAIRDEVFDEEYAAYKLIEYILEIDKNALIETYGIEIEEEMPYDVLELIGKKTGCLMSGGKVDRVRTANRLINDFRKGKLGGISLEKPGDDK